MIGRRTGSFRLMSQWAAWPINQLLIGRTSGPFQPLCPMTHSTHQPTIDQCNVWYSELSCTVGRHCKTATNQVNKTMLSENSPIDTPKHYCSINPSIRPLLQKQMSMYNVIKLTFTEGCNQNNCRRLILTLGYLEVCLYF